MVVRMANAKARDIGNEVSRFVRRHGAEIDAKRAKSESRAYGDISAHNHGAGKGRCRKDPSDCNSLILVACMAFFTDPVLTEPVKCHRRREFMSGALGLGLSFCSGGVALSQGGVPRSRQSVRIPVTATGQAAIERVRGRLRIAFEDLGLAYGAPIFLRIIKEQKRLEVWVQRGRGAFVRLRFYKICGSSVRLGARRPGRSTAQPEGFYALDAGGLRPQSVAYLGLDMGWPNAFDRAQGWSGPPSLLQAGCAIEPHFGLTDQDMEEVYALVHAALSAGQRKVALHIFPFEMSVLRMLTQPEGRDTSFWRQLAPAWQAFERTKKPPQMRVVGRRYVLLER